MDERGDGTASRRGLLAGGLAVAGLAAAGLLSSCGGTAGEGATGSARAPVPTAPPSPEGVRDRAIAAERALIDAYDTVMATDADPLLASIRAQHQAHLEALGAPADAPSEATRGPSPTRGSLVTLEREAAARCRQDCMEAEDPELVRTLAFIAASEASHVPELRAGA